MWSTITEGICEEINEDRLALKKRDLKSTDMIQIVSDSSDSVKIFLVDTWEDYRVSYNLLLFSFQTEERKDLLSTNIQSK
jgi:hypothetical protein